LVRTPSGNWLALIVKLVPIVGPEN
ncbi:hypothetical protein BMETH_15011771791, partial [methanotrophic bacterial endosymbiont of Bathymodiolus sp.]